MSLGYPVSPGTIIICDYDRGFRKPEMVKKRPAVVISPRLAHRDNLCTVVPLSQMEPPKSLLYQCRIELERPLPPPFAASVFWAKADMLATVGFYRLDLIRTERDRASGRRRYLQPKVSAVDLRKIYRCVLYALGLGEIVNDGHI
jgi:uncharacterized protein YifN (PemK superfamily)